MNDASLNQGREIYLIERLAEVEKERDSLAAALMTRGHGFRCPSTVAGSGSGICNCGRDNALPILAARDAAQRRAGAVAVLDRILTGFCTEADRPWFAGFKEKIERGEVDV